MKYTYLLTAIVFTVLIVLLYQEKIGTEWYINQLGTYLLIGPTVYLLLLFYNESYYSRNNNWIKWTTGGIIINILLQATNLDTLVLYKALATLTGNITIYYFAINLIQKKIRS